MLGKRYDFTEDELKELGDALLKADEIKADSRVYRLVQDYLREKGEQIEKVADRREEKSEEYEKMDNKQVKSIADLRKKIAGE
jgi:chaperonin cofactor prefoldin